MSVKIQLSTVLLMVSCILNTYTQDFDTLFLKPGPDDGKDVLIRSIYPNINEGDHWDFLAMTWTQAGEEFTDRSLIEFDLSSIPEGATIHDARLSLFYSEQTGGIGNSGQNDAYLLKINQAWDEHTITWLTQPSVSFDNPVLLPASTLQYEDYLNINVTGLITDLYKYPDLYHGFSLRLQNEQIYRSLTFASSDQQNPERWPELAVVYYMCEQSIADFSFNIDTELNVSFTNQSQNYDSCSWDFGNGFTSHLQNPTIHFNEEGTYITSLTVYNYCSQNTFIDTLEVYQSGISGWNQNIIKIYPNPFSYQIVLTNSGSIEYSSVKITKFDIDGKQIFSHHADLPPFSRITLNPELQRDGLYTIMIVSDNLKLFRKLMRISP